MLAETAGGAELVVCTTCRFAPDRREDESGRRGGEGLAEALAAALPGHTAGRLGLSLQPMACLFACSSHCTVHLRAPGRMGYLLGRFEPGGAAAEALLDYAAAYLQTPDGIVRFADWPEGVKGHFIARLPPEGRVWRDERQR
jgi:predicted metal-binding protein